MKSKVLVIESSNTSPQAKIDEELAKYTDWTVISARTEFLSSGVNMYYVTTIILHKE